MRVEPNLYGFLRQGMQATEQALNTSVQQLSTGQRVSTPADDPYAAAADLRSLAASAQVDRYTRNGEMALSQMQMADSALSAVTTQLTQAVALGTRGADGTMSTADRATIATQVQGVLAEVVAQANLKFNGMNIFSGTTGAGSAFTPDSASPDGYSYQGNGSVNLTSVGDSLQVRMNIPGDQIFTSPGSNVFGSLTQLMTALNGGSSAAIANATAAVNTSIAHIGQQRVVYAGAINQIQAQEGYLSQETVALSAQQQSLTSVDIATAITNLTQAQTAHSAVLAAAAKVLPTSLLDYLK